ncbi:MULTISPECIES: alpha/beta hydrolase [Acinetobacter]|uniref:alpha/beta hydrolase n=1 Tax=Acinetobacter TaxID=469 RepID=UPI0006460784|nr:MULTISPECIES: alpha/beta hydrolase [Acinetobacter]MBJ8482470.1 alpha/beta hydrolase [Acinetobacter vivianii]OEC92762.1 peptidase S15 [Acinetobacter sp. YK3]
MMENIKFTSKGITCAAWYIPAKSDEYKSSQGRPCIILGNGFGGTKDTGLLDFAEPFSQAGFDTFAFDYRGFGESAGLPRQHVSYIQQREDYHAAIEAARNLPHVDGSRIALWGTSYSGGHVVVVAAQDPKISAVVSMNPATDGLAALKQVFQYGGIKQISTAIGHGIKDLMHAITQRPPHLIPIVGQPGTAAMISTPGAEESYTSMAGPTWRNEVCARAALEVSYNRPVAFAKNVKCPTLIQVGANDQIAPPNPARKTARLIQGPAELLEYPIDHFDFYTESWGETVLIDQINFLKKTLAPPSLEK